MGIVWLDGFESYGVDSGSELQNEMLMYGYETAVPNIGLTTCFTRADGRVFGKSITFFYTSVASPRLRFYFQDGNTITVGFAIRHGGLPYSTEQTLLMTLLYNTGSQTVIYLNNSGKLTIRRTSSSNVLGTWDLKSGMWNYIELKFVCDNTTGEVLGKLNGHEVFHATNVDTQSQASSNVNGVAIFGIENLSLDDLYVATGENFLGPITVECIVPNGDGSVLQWTPSTGESHYDLVSPQPRSEDYIFANVGSGEIYDILSLGDLQYVNAEIAGLYVCVVAKISGDGEKYLDTHLLYANGNAATNQQYISNTYWKMFREFSILTGSWTPDLINSCQIRMETK